MSEPIWNPVALAVKRAVYEQRQKALREKAQQEK